MFSHDILQTLQELGKILVSLLPAKLSPNCSVKFSSACPVFSSLLVQYTTSADWQNSHNEPSWLQLPSRLAGYFLQNFHCQPPNLLPRSLNNAHDVGGGDYYYTKLLHRRNQQQQGSNQHSRNMLCRTKACVKAYIYHGNVLDSITKAYKRQSLWVLTLVLTLRLSRLQPNFQKGFITLQDACKFNMVTIVSHQHGWKSIFKI